MVVGNIGYAAETPQLEVDTLQATISILPPDRKWACRHFLLSDNGAQIAQALRTMTAVVVSDGLLKDGIGSAAFTIVSHVSACEHPIIGALLVPGFVKEGDSHRCELSGLYGIMCTVQCLIDRYDICSGGIHMACNNIQALHIFDPDFLPDPQQANFDLLNALTHLLRTSPLTWTCEHV